MPLITPEDIRTTLRGRLSPRRRLQAWERTNGKCVVCGNRIDGARERWIVEHIRALELGGADELTNMGPAHEACGREKTRDDHTRAAQAKRQKIRHIGAERADHPLPGAKASALKRKIDGTVVPRETRPFGKPVKVPTKCSAPATSRWKTRSGVENALAVGCDLSSHWAGLNKPEPIKLTLTPQSILQPPTLTSLDKPAISAPQDLLPTLPAHLSSLFEEHAVLPGEDPAQYDTVLASIVQQVKPRDVIEALWVKDLFVWTWGANRLRLWRQRILAQARLQAAEALIRPVLEAQDKRAFPMISELERQVRDLALGWLNGREAETTNFKELLQGRGLTVADVTAKAFELKLPHLERIERMMMNADNRRDALLREIERKRASVTQNLSAASAGIVDVEASAQPAVWRSD